MTYSSNGAHSQWRVPRASVFVFAMLALVTVTYANSLSGGFVWDDHPLIEEQPIVKHIQPPLAYLTRSFWSNPLDEQPRTFYRPLVTLSYALNYWMGGGAAWVFRVTNLLLHLLACVLVYCLAREAGSEPSPAVLAAALFGVAPRLTESVAWISGRTDILALLGCFGAVLLARRAAGRLLFEVLAAGALLAGLLCKETAIVALVILLIWNVVERRHRGASIRLASLRPLIVAVAVYGCLRLLAMHRGLVNSMDGFGSVDSLSWRERPIAALEAIGRYFVMLLDPLQPRIQIGSIYHPQYLCVALGAAVLAAGAFKARHLFQLPSASGPALICSALLALLPTLHLMPIPVRVVAADRYLYLPLACLVIVGAVWISRAPQLHARAALMLGLLAVPVFAVRSWYQASLWSNERALWKRAITEAPPGDGLAYAQLGNVDLEVWRVEEALQLFRRAFDIEAATELRRGRVPHSAMIGSIALCEQMLGQFDAAERDYRRAMSDYPNNRVYQYDLIMTFAREGKFAEARKHLQQMKRRHPDDRLADELLDQVVASANELAGARALRSRDLLRGKAAEAKAWDTLGGLAAARAAWNEVASDSNAPPELAADAAGYLAFKGSQAAARAAIERVREQMDDRSLAAKLARIVDERFSD